MLEQVVIDSYHPCRRGLDQAGRCQIVDRTRQSSRKIVNRLFDRIIKDLRVATGLLELKVDVAYRLIFAQGPEVKAHGHPIQKIRMLARRSVARNDSCPANRILSGGPTSSAELISSRKSVSASELSKVRFVIHEVGN